MCLRQSTTMRQQQWLECIVFLYTILCYAPLTLGATIRPVQSINSPANDSLPATSPSTNVTTVGSIDSRFRVITSFLNLDVDENDCVMNVIIAMGILSTREFTQLVKPQTYRDERYPKCFIQTRRPEVARSIEARFLLWGLYAGIRPMIQNNNWKLAEFTLLWDEDVVGFISFATAGTGPHIIQGGSQNPSVQSRSSPPPSPDALSISSPVNPPQGNSSAPDSASFYIDVKPTSYGDPLPKNDIFMAVLECLLYLGPKTSTDVLVAFGVSPPLYDVTLRLAPLSRAEEPFLDYAVAGLGLSAIPSSFIAGRHQQWAEVGFDYKVDFKLVGKGSITRSRR